MTHPVKAATGAKLSRRAFVTGVAAAAVLPGVASAQDAALDELLSAPGRGNWNDQFDAGPSGVAKVATAQPVFSQNTVAALAQAIETHRGIVQMGGWPAVPQDKVLKIGLQSGAVPYLRQRLAVSGDLPQSAANNSPAFDSYVDAGVKRFQERHGLPADGVVAEYTFKALNVPADLRFGQLQTNLQRFQAMTEGFPQRFVMVNVPAAAIEAVEDGRVAQRHTAIVGKVDRQTPILNSEITNLNLNPYWHAPASIVQKDIIPMVRKDPQYLAKSNIHIFNGQGREVPPEMIDWNSDEAVKYLFRQEPGKNNAMSSVKINFPNPHAVYMHDTPQQGLFSKLMRFDSSGCVRVQNVRDLIVWLAKYEQGWDRQAIESVIASRQRKDIDLQNPVPVFFTYITAWASDPATVQFRDDIYHRDGAAALASGDLTAQAYAPGQVNPYAQGDNSQTF